MRLRKYHNELVGIAFLLPNILGFLVFILIPLLLSFTLAFSNWDINLHNMFRDRPLEWVALENFQRLLQHPRFWQYFGNTLFLMMGIPFSIAGSLIAALMLSQNLKGRDFRMHGFFIAGAVLIAAVLLLLVAGFQLSGLWLLLALFAGSILIGGTLGGSTVYRTLFYTPHFTAGVATYILWKKMYNPQTGPVNLALRPVLDSVAAVVNALPTGFGAFLFALFLAGAWFIARSQIRRLARSWCDEDIGWLSMSISTGIILIPAFVAWDWLSGYFANWIFASAVLLSLLLELGVPVTRIRRIAHLDKTYRLGDNLMLSLALMVVQFVLIGFSLLFFNLPGYASDGLSPPDWLTDYHWAKPAIMIMSLWAAIGSNHMILYLAGLSNVPQELYDAADIDGASRFQRFWNVTWPQLAPMTFFIVVMSMIHGLQGGFEMARTMTEGGPAGATTTLSYFVYIEGFETGRLGFACAVAWTLFALIFLITVFNVRFGNRYVND